MNGWTDFWAQGDAVSRGVAVLLLVLSVSSWVTLLWKGWLLRRVRHDVKYAARVFWQAPDLALARAQLAAADRESVLVPLAEAALNEAPAGTVESGAQPHAVLTRRLRDALHEVLGRLQAGQVLLASVGSTAPFIGLFGTVWGIYHALLGIAGSGSLAIDKVAGPVGEALVMTAAGLAVAIPAVLAYNLLNQWIGALEAELEGFAHDLRELLLGTSERPLGGAD